MPDAAEVQPWQDALPIDDPQKKNRLGLNIPKLLGPLASLRTPRAAPADTSAPLSQFGPQDSSLAVEPIEQRPLAEIATNRNSLGERNVNVSPTGDHAGVSRSAPGHASAEADKRPQIEAPDLTPSFSATSPLAVTPKQPARPGTDAYRLQEGRPQLKGGKLALDIIGQVFAPTVERAIPGTPGYYDRLKNRTDAQTMEQAKIREQGARADQEESKAYSLRNPKPPTPPRPENIDQEIADASVQAQREGRDPNTDPKVLQLIDVKQRGQKETKPTKDTNAAEGVRQQLLTEMQGKNDPKKVDTLGKQLEKLTDPSGEKETLRKLTMESLRQKISEKNAKDTSLSPHAQQILIDTEPTLQQVDQLLQALEPYKGQNKRLTMDRIGYAFGQASPEGSLAGEISKLEMDRVLAGARVLKGSSRAYQALELAMKHAPNSWVDTTALMHQKLTNIRQNLADVIEDAKKFGVKNLPSSVATGTVGAGKVSAGAPQGDTVNVIAPDGTPGTIPRANLQKALAKGYKQQ